MKVTLDLFGEQRTVEVDALFGGKPSHVAFIHEFVGTIGNGTARYPTSLSLWRVTEDKPANRNNTIVVADDGSEWQFNLSTVIRNRNNARIVGWADVEGVTNAHNQRRSQ